jgi:hypothetical protein
LRTIDTVATESAMTTIISSDPVGRFAALDHSILEEVQAIMEARGRPGPLANDRTCVVDCRETEPQHQTWIQAARKMLGRTRAMR